MPDPSPIPPSSQAAAFVGRGGVLDALRFLTACWIVVYHYGNEAPVTLDRLNPMFLHGYLATDFFLMLSGYVMARVYGDGLISGAVAPLRFLTRRIQRIWPAHLIVLAAMVAFVLAATAAGVAPGHPGRFQLRDVIPQALLIQAWGPVGGAGWNLPTWSLSALLACYAFTPLMLHGLNRIGSAPLALAGAVALLALCDLACARLLHTSIYELHIDRGVLRAAPLFLLGVATARCAQLNPMGAAPARVVAVVATLSFFAAQALGRLDFFSMAAIAALLLAVGSRSVRRPIPALETAARLSFALFLTHVLTATVYFGAMHHLSQRHGFPIQTRWALWGLSLPLALAVAAVFDRSVDAPVQAWLKTRRAPAQARVMAI